MQILSWSFICGAIAGPAIIDCGVMHQGWCHPIKNATSSENFASAKSCLSECTGRPTCNTWAWISGTCYFMTNVSLSFQRQDTQEGNCVFGIKCDCAVRTTNYTYMPPLESYMNKVVDRRSADSCEQECDIAPDCLAWTWYPKEAAASLRFTCFLVNTLIRGYRKSSSFAVSSRKCQCGVIHSTRCSADQSGLSVYSSTATTCHELCNTMALCKIWVWSSTACTLSMSVSLAFRERGLRSQSCTFGLKCGCRAREVGLSYLRDVNEDTFDGLKPWTTSADYCEQHCEELPECVAWSWYPVEADTKLRWNCYLFNHLHGNYGESNSVAISSRKCVCGIEHQSRCFPDRLLVSDESNVSHRHLCSEKCMDRETCNTWAWILGTCYLMDGNSIAFQAQFSRGRECAFGLKCGCSVRGHGVSYFDDGKSRSERLISDMPNADACEGECEHESQCTAWSWYPEKSHLRQNCFLFYGLQGIYGRSDDFAISSRKCRCGERRAGYIYKSDDKRGFHGIPSAGACEDKCGGIGECTAWSWHFPGDICFLFSESTHLGEPSKSTISSRKCATTHTRVSETTRNVTMFLFVNVALHNNATEDGLCTRDHPLFVAYEEALLHLLNGTGGLKNIVVVNVEYSFLDRENEQFLNRLHHGSQLLLGVEYSLKLSTWAEYQLEEICRDEGDILNADIRFSTVYSTIITKSQEKFERLTAPRMRNCSDATDGRQRTSGSWVSSIITLVGLFVVGASICVGCCISSRQHRLFSMASSTMVMSNDARKSQELPQFAPRCEEGYPESSGDCKSSSSEVPPGGAMSACPRDKEIAYSTREWICTQRDLHTKRSAHKEICTRGLHDICTRSAQIVAHKEICTRSQPSQYRKSNEDRLGVILESASDDDSVCDGSKHLRRGSPESLGKRHL